MARPNAGASGDLAVKAPSRKAEFEAFDALPRAVREKLNGARVMILACAGVAEHLAVAGLERTLAALDKLEAEAEHALAFASAQAANAGAFEAALREAARRIR